MPPKKEESKEEVSKDFETHWKDIYLEVFGEKPSQSKEKGRDK